MTKDSLVFFAFVAKLIFLQSSYVAQYPATTIRNYIYINFDRQATYKLVLHLQSSLAFDSKNINLTGNARLFNETQQILIKIVYWKIIW